eukprot:5185802-Pyramimonas_sp.AAC.1
MEAGVKYSDGSRLCFDVVEAALASSKSSREEKGSIKALTCQAVWPLSRAVQAGYIIEDICPLRGQPGDRPPPPVVLHRVRGHRSRSCWG